MTKKYKTPELKAFYEANPGIKLKSPDLDDAVEAYWWLLDHPHFFYVGSLAGHPGFGESLDIMLVKVNPDTMCIDEDGSKNRLAQVWLECGPWDEADPRFPEQAEGFFKGQACHEYKLDVGADTFEKAICKLAKGVMKRHGTYPKFRHCSSCLVNKPSGPTDPWQHWYCSDECVEAGPHIPEWERAKQSPRLAGIASCPYCTEGIE